MNIVKTDSENISVTVDLFPHELKYYIDLYDKWAGECLRKNDLQGAVSWVDRAKEIKKQQDIALGIESADQD